MQGLELRRAILQAIQEHQRANPMMPKREDELAKELGVGRERLDAHFTFMERAKYVSFLYMNDPQGNRQRFVQITDAGEAFLKDSNAPAAKALDAGPFKVVERGAEKVITEFGELRTYVEGTEWVLDDEKPEILARVDELEKVLNEDRFNPAKVSELKLYFERHRWLSSHVTAIVKKRYGL